MISTIVKPLSNQMFAPQICSHAFRVVFYGSYSEVDLRFSVRTMYSAVGLSRLRGLPLRYSMCREPVQTMLRGRPARCAKCRRLRLWRLLGCRGRPMVASICGLDLATEVGARRAVQFIQSCQPSKSLLVTFFVRADTEKTERARSDVDSRMFFRELGAVAVERLEVFACGLLSRVMSVASRSHSALPLVYVTLKLDSALPVSSQSTPPSARVLVGRFSWVTVELAGCLGEHLLSLRMMSSGGTWVCTLVVARFTSSPFTGCDR